MTSNATFDVVEHMERLQEAAKDRAARAMEAMRDVAEQFGQEPIGDRLGAALKNLRNDEFQVVVMGRFNHGKSTLLNALLAETTHPVDLEGHRGPMLTGRLPTTGILTGVRYSAKPYVVARRWDDDTEDWGLSRYLQDAKLDGNGLRQQAERLREVREFAMGYPARLCRAGIAVYDSPGLGEDGVRSDITNEALVRADAAVMVFSTIQLLGQDETEKAKEIVETDTPLFYVVNVFPHDDDDRLTQQDVERYVWNKLVHEILGGPPYADGARLADRNVYLVNARQALVGRVGGDDRAVAESGILEFERVLLGFLANDTAAVHIGKHVRTALIACDDLRPLLVERTENASLERTRAKADYERMQPMIADLRRRPQLLHQSIDAAEADLRRELHNSLQVMVHRTRDGLADHLEGVALPTASRKLTAAFRQKQLQEEAGEAASAYVIKQVAVWAAESGELGRITRRTAAKLSAELEVQTDVIETTIAEIKNDLGFRVADLAGGPGTMSRIVGGLVGGFFLGPVGAVAGAALSGRALLGGVAGAAATGGLLGLVGLTGAIFPPAVIAMAVLSALLSVSVNQDRRAKAKLVEATAPQFAELAERLQKQLDATVGQVFVELRAEVDREVVGRIESEIRNIEDTVELSQRGEHEKVREIASLQAGVARLDGLRVELYDSVSMARMGEAPRDTGR